MRALILALCAILGLSFAVASAEGVQKKDEIGKPIRGIIQAKPADAPRDVVAVLEVHGKDKPDTLNLTATGEMIGKILAQTGGATDVIGTLSADKKTLAVTFIVPITVRQRYVPGKSGKASFTALHHFPDEKGDLATMGHADIGGSIYIHEEGGPILFNVLVTGGNDGQLALEVHAGAVVQKLEVKRDGTAPFQVAGVKYEVDFPSTWVDAKRNPVVDQVMLFVRRLNSAAKPAASAGKQLPPPAP